MIGPKISNYTIGRCDHINTGEAELNDLKYNIMKMIETLKEKNEKSP